MTGGKKNTGWAHNQAILQYTTSLPFSAFRESCVEGRLTKVEFLHWLAGVVSNKSHGKIGCISMLFTSYKSTFTADKQNSPLFKRVTDAGIKEKNTLFETFVMSNCFFFFGVLLKFVTN